MSKRMKTLAILGLLLVGCTGSLETTRDGTDMALPAAFSGLVFVPYLHVNSVRQPATHPCSFGEKPAALATEIPAQRLGKQAGLCLRGLHLPQLASVTLIDLNCHIYIVPLGYNILSTDRDTFSRVRPSHDGH